MAAAAGDKLDRALAKDQIYQAEAAADELEALAAKDPAGRAELGKRAAKIASLRSNVKELNGLLQELRSNDGWEFATEVKKKEITVHFKIPKGSPFVLTKARKVIRPVPGKPLTYTFVALCSLFAEVRRRGGGCIRSARTLTDLRPPLLARHDAD